MVTGRQPRIRFSAVESEPSPRGKYIFRLAAESDAQGVIDAFNKTFGLQRSAEYWRSKFITQHGPISLVAVDADNMIHGQFSGYPALLRNGSSSEHVLFAGDVFARRSTAAIRQGLFLKLFQRFCFYHATVGHYSGIVGFPNDV